MKISLQNTYWPDLVLYAYFKWKFGIGASVIYSRTTIIVPHDKWRVIYYSVDTQYPVPNITFGLSVKFGIANLKTPGS